MEGIKQYTIEYDYTGNYKVSKYINGKLEGYDIVAGYKLYDHINYLRSFGYTKAYNVSYYENKLNEAKEEYEFALEAYNTACRNALYGSDAFIRDILYDSIDEACEIWENHQKNGVK